MSDVVHIDGRSFGVSQHARLRYSQRVGDSDVFLDVGNLATNGELIALESDDGKGVWLRSEYITGSNTGAVFKKANDVLATCVSQEQLGFTEDDLVECPGCGSHIHEEGRESDRCPWCGELWAEDLSKQDAYME